MPRTLSVFAVRLLAIDGSGRKAVERSERVVAIPSRFAFFSLPFPSPFARGAILFSLLFSPFFRRGAMQVIIVAENSTETDNPLMQEVCVVGIADLFPSPRGPRPVWPFYISRVERENAPLWRLCVLFHRY